jgi:hypothetical protein
MLLCLQEAALYTEADTKRQEDGDFLIFFNFAATEADTGVVG